MKDIIYYQNLIAKAKKQAENYLQECRDIQDIYEKEKRLNILFSNAETLSSALSTNNPKPVIRTRFSKQNAADKAEKIKARLIGEIVERTTIFNNDSFNIQEVLKDITERAVKFGRGIPRIYYDAEIKQDNHPTDTLQNQAAAAAAQEYKGKESVKIISVNFDEFLCQDVKKWEKLGWMAFLHLLDKDGLKNDFGPEQAEKIPLTRQTPAEDKSASKENFAAIWEIWDKAEKKVIFIAEEYNQILREIEDPYNLQGFFPVPCFLQFIIGKSLMPVPEFRVYKKIVTALEKTCMRIDAAVDNIKSVAIAAAKNKDLLKKITNAKDNTTITADINIEALVAQGGIKALICEYPNSEKLQVLQTLEAEKQLRLAEIYEITGIADIMRGQSAPEETAAAQKIKGKFGSLRLQARQRVVQNTIKDCFKMITELICEHFSQENLALASAIALPSEQQKQLAVNQAALLAQQGQVVPPQINNILNLPTWEDILTILNSDRLRNYTIEVESTATIFDADQLDKAERMSFFQQVSAMISAALPFLQANPEFIPAYRQNILFTIDAFPNSRILKETFEEAFAEWEARISNPQPPAPNPDMVLAQAEQTKAQAELQKVEVKKLELQIGLAKIQQELNQKQQSIDNKAYKDLADIKLEADKLDADNKKFITQNCLKKVGF